MEIEGGAGNMTAGGEPEKEGSFLLGDPTFVELGNGRLRCAETGHEMPVRDRDSYARSRACRIALIDAAFSCRKPPLNFFRPHAISKSKVVCDLTGDTVNKSEEHIWRHISGRRFLSKLAQREAEKVASADDSGMDIGKSKKQSRGKIEVKKSKKDWEAIKSLPREHVEQSSDSEDPDFWVPPVGDRWDFDVGKDRWDPCTGPNQETDDGTHLAGNHNDASESLDLAIRTKRMSIAMGPSSFASMKKKTKRTSSQTKDSQESLLS